MKTIRYLVVALATFSLCGNVNAAGHKPSKPQKVRFRRTDIFEVGKKEVNPYSAHDGTADIIDERVVTDIGREEYQGTKTPPDEREVAEVSVLKSQNPAFDTAVWVEETKATNPTFDPALMQSIKLYRVPRRLPLERDEEESDISANSYDQRMMGPRYSLQEWRTMAADGSVGGGSIARTNHSSTPLSHSEEQSSSDAKSRSSSVSRRSEKLRMAERKNLKKKAVIALRKSLRERLAQHGHVVHPPKKRVMKVTRPHLADSPTTVFGGKLDDFAERGTITSVRGPE